MPIAQPEDTLVSSTLEAWRQTGVLDRLVSELLFTLDEVCRQRLNSGESELFGSSKVLWEKFQTSIGTLPPFSDTGHDAALATQLFDQLVVSMEAEGDIFFASDRHRCRSRAFELAHYLRNLRQRTPKREAKGVAPRLVEQLKVEVRRRERPIRTCPPESLEDAVQYLGDELSSDEGWDLEFANDLGRCILVPFARHFFRDGLAAFQVAAFRQILRTSLGLDDGRAFVISAGTGFGKTEAFLLPALALACLNAGRRAMGNPRESQSPCAVLLYPRVDLCNNQLERTLRYILKLNDLIQAYYQGRGQEVTATIRVSISHGRLDDSFRIACPICEEEITSAWTEEERSLACIGLRKEQYAWSFECLKRRGDHVHATAPLVYQTYSQSDSADIAITTIDTLHRRLMDDHGTTSLFRRNSRNQIRILVADEMHIYEGQSGAHAAHILRRARQRIQALRQGSPGPVCVGASATIANPRDLARKLLGHEQAVILEPSLVEREAQGIEYFFFVKSQGNRIVNFTPPPANSDDDAVGSVGDAERDVFVSERATVIQAVMALQHTMKTGTTPGSKRRSLGFVDSVDGASRLGRQLADAEWKDCEPRLVIPSNLAKQVPLYALRLPVGRPGINLQGAILEARRYVTANQSQNLTFAFPQLGMECPRRESSKCHQPPHHLLERCARYESGECWFTLGSGGENLRPPPIQVHTASERSWGRSAKVEPKDQERWRVLISTSTLEVGFDHPEIIATWQYHAPPSVASFLQRKGRGGRGLRDHPMTMMVLGPGASDSHAFRDHQQYVEGDGLQCFLDDQNPSVRTQHVFAAVMDYCAATGRQSFKNMTDIPSILNRNQREALAWVTACFPMKQAEAIRQLEAIKTFVQQHWCDPLDASCGQGFIFNGAQPHRLFQKDRQRDLEDWRRALDPRKVRTIAWINSALRWIDKNQSFKRDPSVIDMCAFTPPSFREDPDLRVPESTIPTPLGGSVVLQITTDGRAGWPTEASTFALRSFLPGGFKIRYGRLLMAPWVSAATPSSFGPNATWAATRSQIQALEGREYPTDLSDLLRRSRLSSETQAEIRSNVGNEASLIFPESLKLNDLGAPRQRNFLLDEESLVVHAKRPEESGTFNRLSQEPNVTPLTFMVPKGAMRPQPVLGAGSIVGTVNFHSEFRTVDCYYGNLVHCYPMEGDARTLVVRFHDENANRPLIVGVEYRTQALELSLGISALSDAGLSGASSTRAFWRRVQELLGGRSLLEQGRLPNLYLVQPIVAALQFLEISVTGKVGGFATHSMTEADWRTGLQGLNRIKDFGPPARILQDADIQDLVQDCLQEASHWCSGIGTRQVVADSVMGAFSRLAARSIGVSIDSLVRLVMLKDDGAHLFLMDSHDGGSGSTRRISEEWQKLGVQEIERQLVNEHRCAAATVDETIRRALTSRIRPEALAAMQQSDSLPGDWFNSLEPHEWGRAKRRLARLIETPALTAFNIYVMEQRQLLERSLGAPPPESWLLGHVRNSPALDVRAESLRQSFLQEDGGLSELPSRLLDVAPLCEAGCPECIGSDQWRDAGYADRLLLQSFGKGGNHP